MFTVSKAAAEKITDSARQSEMDDCILRIAARSSQDGSIEYVMGFDTPADSDISVNTNGVTIIFDESMRELLEGSTMDFVELDPGTFEFIFLNPNDPYYKPPKENS